MAIIGDVHVFQMYEGKAATGLDAGYMEVVTRFKKTKDNPNPKPAMSVVVPVPQVPEIQIAALDVGYRSIIYAALGDAVAAIVRDRYMDGKTDVHSADISAEACLAYLAQQRAGGRLTKEAIEDWASVELADAMRLRFAAVMGLSDEQAANPAIVAKIEANVAVYIGKLAALSGGRTYYSATEASKLLKALQLLEGLEDDAMGSRLATKLQEMIATPKDAEDLMAL
jgi:hypothetical protein